MGLILSANINCGSINLLNFLKSYEPNPRSFSETTVGFIRVVHSVKLCFMCSIEFVFGSKRRLCTPTNHVKRYDAVGQKNRTEDGCTYGKEGGLGLNPSFRNENN